MSSRITAADSTDGETDSGQLWIMPRLPRASTYSNAGRVEYNTVTRTQQSTTAKLQSQRPERSVEPKVVEGRGRRRDSHAVEPRVSATQMAAWYAPRILLLFVLGWAWSVGVQFIHTQQHTLAGPMGERGGFVERVQQTSVEKATTLAAAPEHGEYDSSDSDDESPRWWRDVDTAGGLARDAVARVLESAAWSNGASGLMTAAVGMAYPFLDHRWRSAPRRAVAWNDVLRCAGGFLGVNYAALKLPFESASQSAAIMLIISLGLWTLCDGSLHGLLLSAFAALAATWLLIMHALGFYARFSQDDCLRLMACLPSLLFTYCVMTGGIGRRLGHRPPPLRR
ncbi:hypothetical protein COEREDRAFT_81093 [Coemansia reversa NRRL 1564]|uniref:INSIG-domain-containing protein n=1 Tax=Coemansia reversa (strain ATCC 12441 / NRRL 1564) TaxID=763665 RepID=A0A2G5BCJ5_COERN|nr:hypothetical protein COEREDRAFT_81093 [Coemansia reversa NRRL 1564]|eukprot:PIA16744.1 hypothetical protein COEREDRAFT_81093 [Coemansia reversa NRRL 1564]